MTDLSQPGCKAIDQLSSKLKDPVADVSEGLLQFEVENAQDSTALCQHGLLHDCETRVNKIIEVRTGKTKRSGWLKQAKTWLDEYEGLKEQMAFRQRRKKLEDVIRLLLPIKDNDRPETGELVLLARAYLYRSMLFRPKGYTTPARKIEALLEAHRLLPEKDHQHETDIWKLWAQVCLELENENHFQFSEEDKKNLKRAVEAVVNSGVSGMGDLLILVRYAEIAQDASFLEPVFNETRNWGQPFDLMLFKARSSFLKTRDPEEIHTFAKQAIEKSPEAFSDPFWNELVWFLNRIKAEKQDIWKQLSLDAWELCRAKEKEITTNVILHWHWSQRKALYDLAFLAAETPKDKARVADSLKSRPALRYNALQDMRNRETVKRILETEDGARDRRYLKNFSGKMGREISGKIEKYPPLPSSALPDEWVAVHFYLNEADQTGYALVVDSKGKWKECRFDYRELFLQFQKWQAVYATKDEAETSKIVYRLCRKIGETMPFLFDKNLFYDKSVLFVPHGFLHHLPLHAAIEKDSEKVFFVEHAVRYLPAWHLTRFYPKNYTTNGKWYFTVNTEAEGDYEKLLKLFPGNQESEKKLEEYLRINPEVLAVLCHGKCDLLNPFRSKLMLNPEWSILDILSFQSRIKGARIFLGACESDMSPFSDNPLDEHLSLSSVFLTSGAREVIGGVYRLEPPKIDMCYRAILEKAKKEGLERLNLPEELQSWQIEKMKKKPSENPRQFYEIIPFRIMGFPEGGSQ